VEDHRWATAQNMGKKTERDYGQKKERSDTAAKFSTGKIHNLCKKTPSSKGKKREM